jgi:hypothetical protein
LERTGYASFEQCQREMDHWRHDYNEIRPHQALDQHPLLSRYQASARAYPEQLPPLEYDEGDRVLKVKKKGQIDLGGRIIFVSEGLAGQHVAIRSAERDGVFNIVFIYKTICQVDFNAKENLS